MKDKSKNNCKTLAILKNHLEKMASVDKSFADKYSNTEKSVEDCLRYKAHKELLKLGLKKMFYYYCDPDYNPTTQTCKMMLWKEK